MNNDSNFIPFIDPSIVPPNQTDAIGLGFTKLNSFSFKGRFAVWANIIAGTLLIGAAILAFVLFDFSFNELDVLLRQILLLLGGFVIVLASIALMMLAKLVALKRFGGGKCGIHFGGLMEVYSAVPVSKFGYLLGEIIPAVFVLIAGALAFFFWGLLFYTVLVFLIISLIPNIIVWVWIVKQSKGSYFMLEKGVLNSYTKIDLQTQ